jgi:hypothetical protein
LYRNIKLRKGAESAPIIMIRRLVMGGHCHIPKAIAYNRLNRQAINLLTATTTAGARY